MTHLFSILIERVDFKKLSTSKRNPCWKRQRNLQLLPQIIHPVTALPAQLLLMEG